jgi:hypothetical protein
MHIYKIQLYNVQSDTFNAECTVNYYSLQFVACSFLVIHQITLFKWYKIKIKSCEDLMTQRIFVNIFTFTSL